MKNNSDHDKTSTFTILTNGTQVSHYRIVEKIGAGGMGEVFLADDTKLQRRVALKFLPAHFNNDSQVRARFTREAQSAAKLNHPNIVTIHEVSDFNGRPFFSMEYVEGRPLNYYCSEKKLSTSEIINLAVQIADGLTKAHQLGIIHRDIKSSNIVVDSEKRAKILDFGLAFSKGGEQITKAGSTLGTVAYMSPEQAQGREIDHRSDLFSFGAVLYELITGRTPFKRDNDASMLVAIINEGVEPLVRYASDVPPELQRIVSKCLAKNLEERYQSAADVAADFRTVARSLSSGKDASSGQVTASRPSIAVLPFTNMSADPENEYFSDGLTEELLNALAKNPELKVSGRTSSFAFKGKQEDLRGIGQKLGVGTLLEGSVRKAGNRVRITAQLVNAVDGFHLWSETYDRVLDDIFAVQDDIAKSVSTAMNVTLLGKSLSKRPANPESYALVLRANQSSQLMNKSGLSVAVELYQKAIDIEPDNARALAGLGLTLAKQIAFGHANYNEAYSSSKEAAQKALALDDALPEAHQAMGFILGALEMRFEECGISYRKAYALAPNDSRFVSSLSVYEGISGRFDESLRLSKLAAELDPLNPEIHRYYGIILFWAGHLDKAIGILKRTLELSPDNTAVHLNLGWVFLFQGRLEEALTEMNLEKLAGYRNCGLAMVYHAMGKKQESDLALETLFAEGDHWGVQIAGVYAFREERDKAFEWLEKSYKLRDSGISLTKVHPTLKNLHSDPRWPVFLKKIGLGD